MGNITMQQAIQNAQGAGFTGSSAQIIAAIAMAESSLDPSAQHTNNDGSIDRGILQINSRWHPEVTDACAYDTACSFQQSLRISSNGSNFSPWSTYTSGAYQQYLGSSTLLNPPNRLMDIPNPVQPVTDAISGIQQILDIVKLFTLPNIKTALFKTGLFIIAAAFIVIGFLIIAQQPNGGSVDLSGLTKTLKGGSKKSGGEVGTGGSPPPIEAEVPLVE
jgi:hypothetical protein